MTEDDSNRLWQLLKDAEDEIYFVKEFQKLVEAAEDYLRKLHHLRTEDEAKDRAKAILECYLIVVQAKLETLTKLLELASDLFKNP